MARWICPRCDREFGRTRQAHICVPGCTVEQCFAGRPPVQREIYDRLIEHVVSLGDVHIDAVVVGVFVKSDRTVAEIRPKARSLELWLNLPHALDHPRVSRALKASQGRIASLVKLVIAADVDDQVREWLTDAYDEATDA